MLTRALPWRVAPARGSTLPVMVEDILGKQKLNATLLWRALKVQCLSAEKNADHTRSHVSSCVDVALTLSAPLPSWMHLNKPLPIHTRSYRNSTTCKYRSGIICSSSRRRTARTCKPTTSAAAQRQTAGSTSTAYVPNVMTLSCILIII